jgi:hypothetical protein
VSLADPLNVSAIPAVAVAPFGGLAIVTTGAVFVAGAAATDTVIPRCVVRPPLSVTVAVMVWVPAVSVRVKLPPVPIWPSRFDRHTSELVRFPYSVSLADPVNVVDVPSVSVAPFAGLAIVAAGAVFATGVVLTVIDSMWATAVVYPMLSTTFAVMVWDPAGSLRENDAPVPICPEIVDRQTSLLEMFPSVVSVADPEKLTVVVELAVAPLPGARIVTVGAVSASPAPPAYSTCAPATSSEDNVRIPVEQELYDGYIVAADDVEWLRPSACPSSWVAMSSM